MTGLYEQLQESVNYVQEKIPGRPRIGVVLGTGWKDFTHELDSSVCIEYPDIPNDFDCMVGGQPSDLLQW